MITFESTVTLDVSIAKRIQEALLKAGNDAVQVGWFGGITHADPLNKESESTIAGVAARNEFGVEPNPAEKEFGVPKRAFIRPTVQVRTVDQQVRYLRAGYRSLFTGKNTVKVNQQKIGRHLVKALQHAIDSSNFHGKPRNSKFIADRKGFNKPLVGRTRTLRNTIKYRIAPRDNT